jgi:hypothetical protein
VAISQPQCVGSTIGASGGGGLARRPIVASIAIVVLAVVATTIAVVVVFVVVFVPVATVATVVATGRARRCGGWWLGYRGCSIGVEHHRGSRRTHTIHVDLLQEQIILNFEKVRKWRVAPNDGAHMLEALV